MPDAQALMGVNVERLRTSSLARSLWARMPAQQPELPALIAATGFDPLRDLDEALVASPGGSTKQNALLLLRGRFRAADWIELAKSRGANLENFQGVPILTLVKDQQPMSVAFAGGSLMIAGDPASVRGAVARRDRPTDLPAQLSRDAAELCAQYDVWFISSGPLSEMGAALGNPEAAGILEGDVGKAIEQISAGVRLGEGLQLALRTVSRTEQDATRLADALRFFSGFAQARQPSGPSLLEDLRQDGRHLTVSLTIRDLDFERMLRAVRSGGEAARPKPGPPAETGITVYSSPGDMGVVKIPGPKPQ